MSIVWGPTDALWAARLGELCGGADGAPSAEWRFLEGWLSLLGVSHGCLVLLRPGRPPTRFCRDGARVHGGGPQRLRRNDSLARLYLRLFKPPYPTRLFEDRTSALAWLRSIDAD